MRNIVFRISLVNSLSDFIMKSPPFTAIIARGKSIINHKQENGGDENENEHRGRTGALVHDKGRSENVTIEFTIPGVPQGKERPRFTQNGATYTPKKTKDYEKLVAWAYQCEAHGAKFTGAIRVDIAAIYPVPHSWSKRKQAEAIDNRILPMVKPDWDN